MLGIVCSGRRGIVVGSHGKDVVTRRNWPTGGVLCSECKHWPGPPTGPVSPSRRRMRRMSLVRGVIITENRRQILLLNTINTMTRWWREERNER